MIRVDSNHNPPLITREPLPHFLVGNLAFESLADLSWVPEPYNAEIGGIRYLPEVVEPLPEFDPATQAIDYVSETLVADLDAKVVRVSYGVRELTAEELSIKAAALRSKRDQLVQLVDDKIAGIYSRWMRFESEYREREAAARRFKDADYNGDAGIWVTAFADSAGKTVQQAADLIIAQADQLRAALEQLGALRMTKYAILATSSVAAAQAKYDGIVNRADEIASALI